MFSQRRIRFMAATALIVFILYLHYSSDSQSVRNQTFYQSTVAAINAEKAGAGNTKAPSYLSHTGKEQPGSKPSEEYTYVEGDDKEEPAIPKAQPEPQQPLQASADQDTEEIPIAGRTKMTVPKEKGPGGSEVETETDAEAAPWKEDDEDEEKKKQKQLEIELAETKAELNDILKRSPVIIFSKSYCPFSKKAKAILLGKYTIVPAPFVVELDQHPLGPRLQSLLGENTGRHTVPNILVNGRSIGGGDDIAALDDHDELAPRLKSLGGKWLQDVNRNEDSTD
ncbi:glutaredoxin [Aspergillus undulatus]|uniref:glutaredoxin n=1 Tax=Aspergillus undulatus TaxID=1810928 RepID=UPI003CCDEA68